LTLILSLALAGASFGSILGHRTLFAFFGSTIFFVMWFALVVYATVRFQWRGLWTLLGFPLAAFVPFYYWLGELMTCGGLDCN
jgi:hypothetical protein